MLASGALDEDSPHGLGSGGEEMRAVLPAGLRIGPESEPRFMDERGGLECVARWFIGHPMRRHFAQFVINDRQQPFGSTGLALMDVIKDVRQLAHARYIESSFLRWLSGNYSY